MTHRRRRLPHALRTTAAAVLVAALSLLILEAGVRVLRLAPPVDGQYSDNVRDPVLPFKPRPLSHLTGQAASGEFAYDYQHNSDGFRDVEHTDEKPAGVFRIVALGDSFTYGVGAAFDETYPSQVERLLNQRPAAGSHTEVIRLGVPRYFPAAERLVLEHRGLRYKPDLVVLGLLPNDIVDTFWGLDSMNLSPVGMLLSRRGQQLGSLGVWLCLHSHLARSLLSRWSASIGTVWRPLPTDEFFRDNGPYEATWTAMEADVEAMARSAREHQAVFAIVSIPQCTLGSPENEYLERRMQRWSAAHGVLFIPTLPAFRVAAARGTSLHWQQDGHCTAAGYAIIAQQLVATIVKEGLAS